MKFNWKPAGPAAFELGPWRVQKDWATNLWDVYLDGKFVVGQYPGAVEAMDEAEELGA